MIPYPDILQFVQENDVKFIRLAFCNLYGNQKNIAITVDRLEHVLQYGLRFDGSLIEGFAMEGTKDLYLHPMPETMQILPWRPQHGRVIRLFCHIRQADGTSFPCDARSHLENVVKQYQKKGLACEVGSKASFYLFLTDEYGNPTSIALDRGGYLDVSPLDRGETVRREACLMLEEMGIRTENSLHAQGPGQNAISLTHNTPLQAADDLLTFQSVTGMAAATNGLFASFEKMPLKESPQNWLHINLSLHKDGKNLCAEGTPLWMGFVAGIRKHLAEICSLIYSDAFCAEAETLLRIPPTHASGEAHLQIQFPCAVANSYWLLALMLHAGLDGFSMQNDIGITSGTLLKSTLGDGFCKYLNHINFQA